MKEFLAELPREDRAEVIAAMKDVATAGLSVARHLRGEIYEVRAEGARASYRVLFAAEGNKGRILLALEAFSKKTQKTPERTIILAEMRLREWRHRSKGISL